MGGLPLLFDASGPVATPPAMINAAIIAGAEAAPGYTATLPGTLLEDIASTDTSAVVIPDQARVDAVSSVTPYAANPFVLAQQGQMYGVPQGLSANGSVYEVFTGSPGYVIAPGFTISDGTYQYVIQDGGTVGSGGTSQPLFAVATAPGIFAIPEGTVTTIVSAVPSPYTLTVTNPLAGTPATGTETIADYRSRILDAGKVSISGSPAYIKTLVRAVPGVSARLVSVRQVGAAYEVICGGGDPYQVAGAIYQGVSHVGLLTGSTRSIRNITVSLYEAPDTYQIVFVNPPQQIVTLGVLWNTTLPNFTAGAAVNQYIVLAGQAYLNSIFVGQPINLMVLTEQIQAAIASVLSAINLTTLIFSVTINGIPSPPSAGTSIISSDPEGYFFASATSVTSVQG